jgi:acyl-CoA reductase-like NAD-dependent aldehyde dehydrogenase
MSSYKLLIDGQLVDGAATLDVINPAEGKVLATCARADVAQLNQAVAAAKKAFPAWSALAPEAREAKLNQLADALEAQADSFARLLTQEQTDTVRVIEVRKPLGVVAGIVPWNFPVLLMVMKVGPGLALGNTMVLKPAPTTPLTTLKFGEIAAAILPPGVLNIIVDDNDLGSTLTAHPDIAKVSFTGSTATGKKVMQSVASDLKRLTLEQSCSTMPISSRLPPPFLPRPCRTPGKSASPPSASMPIRASMTSCAMSWRPSPTQPLSATGPSRA